MKKTLGIILMLAMVLATSALAMNQNYKLIEKDTTTWEEIPHKGYANIYLYQYRSAERVQTGSWTWNGQTYPIWGYQTVMKDVISLSGKAPLAYTDYTLIYYGDETYNDQYPYATCLTSFRTSYTGLFMGKYVYNFQWSDFVDNGQDEKFWLVPSADLDCNAGEFIAWNPENILFEHNVI